ALVTPGWTAVAGAGAAPGVSTATLNIALLPVARVGRGSLPPRKIALGTLAFSEYCSWLSSVHRGLATFAPSCVILRGWPAPSAGTTYVSIAEVLSSSILVDNVNATHLPLGEICASPMDLIL